MSALRRLAAAGLGLLGTALLLIALLLFVTEIHNLVLDSTSTLRPQFRSQVTPGGYVVRLARSVLWFVGSVLWLVGAVTVWRHRRPSGPWTTAAGSLTILVGVGVQAVGGDLGSPTPVAWLAMVLVLVVGLAAVIVASRPTVTPAPPPHGTTGS